MAEYNKGVYREFWKHGENVSSGFLMHHYKAGKLGIRKPSSAHPGALAAWMAGYHRANVNKLPSKPTPDAQ